MQQSYVITYVVKEESMEELLDIGLKREQEQAKEASSPKENTHDEGKSKESKCATPQSEQPEVSGKSMVQVEFMKGRYKHKPGEEFVKKFTLL
jgi:hypothetical protein